MSVVIVIVIVNKKQQLTRNTDAKRKHLFRTASATPNTNDSDQEAPLHHNETPKSETEDYHKTKTETTINTQQNTTPRTQTTDTYEKHKRQNHGHVHKKS